MLKQSINLSLFTFLCSSIALAAQDTQPPKRISAQIVDLGKVQSIYMVPGMATMIEIPGKITGIRMGNPDLVKYFRPDHPENEVTLILRSGQKTPTNLIILAQTKKYIFDIIPSKKLHQDSLQIVGEFGGAELNESQMELIDSSEIKSERKK